MPRTTTEAPNFVGALDDALAELRDPRVSPSIQRFLLRLPKAYHTVLRRKAHREGKSMNELVVGAVERYIVGRG